MGKIEEKTKNKHQARSNTQQITRIGKIPKISSGRADIFMFRIFLLKNLLSPVLTILCNVKVSVHYIFCFINVMCVLINKNILQKTITFLTSS